MTTQPTALWLADWLDVRACGGSDWNAKMNAAAAELRRLVAQRDALLEACKAYDQWADKTLCYDRELRPIRAQIRAAIKNAEGGQ
jgi:hypothetical protein